MPSAFTHVAVGAAFGQVAPAEARSLRFGALFAALSVALDLDVTAFAYGIPYAHPLGHRGLAHSLLFAFGLAAAATAVVSRRLSLPRGSALRLLLVSFLAIASHGLLDTATDAGLGIGLLIPFSARRFFLPWRPIRTSSVDPLEFFDSTALAILWSEVVWVWLPTAAASGALWLWRRRRQ